MLKDEYTTGLIALMTRTFRHRLLRVTRNLLKKPFSRLFQVLTCIPDFKFHLSFIHYIVRNFRFEMKDYGDKSLQMKDFYYVFEILWILRSLKDFGILVVMS